MTQVRRKFQVVRVPDGEKTTRVITQLVMQSKRKNKKAAFDKKVIKDDRTQFDAFFPNGNHVRVIGEDELERLGMHEGAGLVDMESGDDVTDVEQTSLREMVERRTQPPRQPAA